MSYQNQIEYDHPIVFKTFDDATNKTHPLVAGLGYSALVTTAAFTHTFDQWNQVPFTGEIWFKPISTNTVTVLGHDDDGIIYDPTTRTISFTIKQSDGSFVTTSQLADSKSMYVVIQYTGYSIKLMVNGVQSTEFTSLPITSTGTLRTGAGKMSVDALALYDYLLSDDQMFRHYYAGIDFPTLGDTYSLAENFFDLTDSREDVLTSLDFTGWSNVYLDGAVINTEGNISNDVAVSNGLLYANVMLPDDQTLQGAKLYYEYTNTPPVVEISVDDGQTWAAASRNTILPGIPVGDAMGDVDPLIRVTLGVDTILTYLRVVVYRDITSTGLKDTRCIKMVRPAVSALEQMFPSEQDTDGGANIGGGSLNLVANTEDTIQQISFWYKGAEPGGGSKNGGLGHIDDQWNFYLGGVTSLPTNYAGRIANVATWDLSQDSSALYQRHFVKQTLSVTETDRIVISEPANGVLVYQNNWIVL